MPTPKLKILEIQLKRLQVTLKYYFRNIKYVGLNENCFIGHLVV